MARNKQRAEREKRDRKIFRKKFGANLKKIRTDKGISQELLANKMDSEISQISRIERGAINTSAYYVNKIANALEIKQQELFDFD